MAFEIRPIESTAAGKQIWQDFFNQQTPDSFLQTWQWGEFQTDPIIRVGVYEQTVLVGLALFIRVNARRGKFLLCPHGPVLLNNRLDVLQALVDYSIQLGKDQQVDFVRWAPLLQDFPSNLAIFSAAEFVRAPIHVHPELSWVLDLTPPEADLLAQMRKTTRYSIRKAEKDGVVVRTSTDKADIKVFHDLYLATVSRHQFTPFSLAYLEREFDSFAQDDMVRIFIAEHEGKPVSGAVVIYTPHSGFYHQGASLQANSKLTASYLLQWEAIKLAKQRGCTKYNFWGISPDDQPKHPWAGLSLFKKGFGGLAYHYVPTQDKPLTWKYRLNKFIETRRRKQRGY